MRVIDLSSPVDPTSWEPEPLTVTTMSAADGAKHMAAEMREHFNLDIDPADLPDGEFLTNDTVSLTTHTGTHIDAPAHYGSRASYGKPRTIDELPLDWFHRPAVVLDLTEAPAGAVDADYLRQAITRTGYQPAPMDIVLLHTGADRLAGTQRYFTDFVGLDASAVHYLLDLGIRVIGTDAFSLDAPFTSIIARYQRTRDRADLWPAHMAGREREFCQIERLAHLGTLPRPYGFVVSCPPVKVVGAGAGWTRAIALVDED